MRCVRGGDREMHTPGVDWMHIYSRASRPEYLGREFDVAERVYHLAGSEGRGGEGWVG